MSVRDGNWSYRLKTVILDTGLPGLPTVRNIQHNRENRN